MEKEKRFFAFDGRFLLQSLCVCHYHNNNPSTNPRLQLSLSLPLTLYTRIWNGVLPKSFLWRLNVYTINNWRFIFVSAWKILRYCRHCSTWHGTEQQWKWNGMKRNEQKKNGNGIIVTPRTLVGLHHVSCIFAFHAVVEFKKCILFHLFFSFFSLFKLCTQLFPVCRHDHNGYNDFERLNQ